MRGGPCRRARTGMLRPASAAAAGAFSCRSDVQRTSLTPPLPDPDSFPPLRAWQRKALVEYLRRRSPDFLAVATPGAGKTTFALRIAAELLADGTVEAVTVVCPTEHLKTQWAAAGLGIPPDPTSRNADGGAAPDGIATPQSW